MQCLYVAVNMTKCPRGYGGGGGGCNDDKGGDNHRGNKKNKPKKLLIYMTPPRSTIQPRHVLTFSPPFQNLNDTPDTIPCMDEASKMTVLLNNI